MMTTRLKNDVKGKQKDEYGNLSEEEEEEMVDMEMGGMEDEPMDDMGDEEGEMVDMEMGGEEMGAEGGEGKMVAVDDFMSALEDALEDALGEPVGVDMDAGDEEEVEMDAEMEMDPEGGEEVEMEMGAEEEEELPGMRDGMYENTDAVVNEVVRRDCIPIRSRIRSKTISLTNWQSGYSIDSLNNLTVNFQHVMITTREA